MRSAPRPPQLSPPPACLLLQLRPRFGEDVRAPAKKVNKRRRPPAVPCEGQDGRAPAGGQHKHMVNPASSPVSRFLRRLSAAHLAADLSDGQLLERFAARRDEAAFAA